MISYDITHLSQGRIYFEYGPISMVVGAWKNGDSLVELSEKSCVVAAECLKEISGQLHCLKAGWPSVKEGSLHGPASWMYEAVKKSGDQMLTPMAAVAGTIADYTADWLKEQGASKVVINNGGDIAIRLQEGEETSVGIVPRIGAAGISRSVVIKWYHRVGGIATSGLGGRSFTQGIADAVTVFADKCSTADACATCIANASYTTSSSIKRVVAKSLDPDTDIPDLMVTKEAGVLSEEEVDKSIANVQEIAGRLLKKEVIMGVVATVQGREFISLANLR